MKRLTYILFALVALLGIWLVVLVGTASAQTAGPLPLTFHRGSVINVTFDMDDPDGDPIDMRVPTAWDSVLVVIKRGSTAESSTLATYNCADDTELTCSNGAVTLLEAVDTIGCPGTCRYELRARESGHPASTTLLASTFEVKAFGDGVATAGTQTVTVTTGDATIRISAVTQASSLATSWLSGLTEAGSCASGSLFPILVSGAWQKIDCDNLPSGGGGSGDNVSVNGDALTNVNLTDSSEVAFAINRTASPDEVSPYLVTGSIANSKLANSTLSLGTVSVALGSSDDTPAFDLQDATGYPALQLTGTLANLNTALGTGLVTGAHFTPSTLASDYSISGTADGTTFVRGDGTYAVPVYTTSASDLTSGTLPDARIAETGVTQHEAAITITESQISDLQSYLLNVVEDATPALGGELDAGGNSIVDLADVTFKTGATGGTLRTGTSNADKFVLQAYDVGGSAYVTMLELDAGNPVASLTGDWTIPVGAVTAHEAALTVTESQVSDLDHLTAAEARTALQENGSAEMTIETLGSGCAEGEIPKTNATGGVDCATDATGAGGGAPADATYWTASADGTLTNEVVVNSLATLNTAISASVADGAHTTDTDFSDTVTHEQIPFDRSDGVAGTDSLKWDGSAGTLLVLGDITVDGASVSTGAHTTDTGPEPDCSGTTTYQDGEGGCDDLSAVYEPLDADIAKTDESNEYGQAQGSTVCTLTDGATVTWNLTSCQMATVTLGGSRTLDATTIPSMGASFSLRVVQDGTGSHTVTWDAAMTWPGGVTPTLSTAANAYDIITCLTWGDGTTLDCTYSQDHQ